MSRFFAGKRVKRAMAVIMKPGEYGRDDVGAWWVRPPVNEDGRAIAARLEVADHARHSNVNYDGSLKPVSVPAERKFTLTEHEDGTVTVWPAIEQRDEDGELVFFGYLVKGEWRRVM